MSITPIPDVTPAPRPVFDPDPVPYCQKPSHSDGDRFLARTQDQPGHTFTDTVRR